jgi:F420-dependent oxidoreductase-like protein
MTVTRFGLQVPIFTYEGVSDAKLFERIADIARTAESSGFDSLWVMDHLNQIPGAGKQDEPMLEAYTLLGGLAARTSTIKLGALVTGVTYRNPALLAKIVTTLDVVSSGRAILGIGAAWFEAEHVAFGYDFAPTGERLARLEEAVQICRAMFTQDRPSFDGRFYRITDIINVPRPVTPGGPPIMVGGGGERKTLRIAARYADATNFFGDPAEVRHKLEVLAQHCADAGRDPSEITKTRLGTIALLASHADAEAEIERRAKAYNRTPDQVRTMMAIGGPEDIAEQVAPYFDAGLDGLIFNLTTKDDLDAIATVGEVLTKSFG